MAHVALNPAFLALPLDLVADVGLSTATSLGASWAEFRLCFKATNYVNTHDSIVENSTTGSSCSLGVRVLVNGVWGFASDPSITSLGALRAARAAIELAKIAAPLTTRKVELAAIGAASVATWNAPIEIDPFDVDPDDIGALLSYYSNVVLRNGAEHVSAHFLGMKDSRFYADTHGNRHIQQRIFSSSELTGTRSDVDGNSVSLRTLAPPVARGWEWMSGEHYNWKSDISELGSLLEEKSKSPFVVPGRYDLIIDPSQLWLTIHESIGHATELDRILGYEANYAGTTFVNVSDLNTLQYGSKLLNVTADRNVPYGLATVAFDDEGIATQSFPLISDGTLVGVQADRGSAQIAGLESTGCAYAVDADHVPIQRMPNISMQPAENGRVRADMIADVEDGLLVIGDDSWSIDMQRKNFQFTGQQFWRIRNGKIDGMVRNAAYQSTTPQFWNSLTEVGGPETYILHGALNCGKGQPGQSAPVSHGAPVARFNQIEVLNTTNNGNSSIYDKVTL